MLSGFRNAASESLPLILVRYVYRRLPTTSSESLVNSKVSIYIKVSESGLVIKEHLFLGASPDGIVFDPVTTDPNGLIEIKCPYQQKDISPREAAHQVFF